jgi:hypothetical protein
MMLFSVLVYGAGYGGDYAFVNIGGDAGDCF